MSILHSIFFRPADISKTKSKAFQPKLLSITMPFEHQLWDDRLLIRQRKDGITFSRKR